MGEGGLLHYHDAITHVWAISKSMSAPLWKTNVMDRTVVHVIVVISSPLPYFIHKQWVKYPLKFRSDAKEPSLISILRTRRSFEKIIDHILRGRETEKKTKIRLVARPRVLLITIRDHNLFYQTIAIAISTSYHEHGVQIVILSVSWFSIAIHKSS